MARSLESLIDETLQYNLFPTNISFDEDYTCKPDKAALVKKLEDWLEKGDLRFSKASSGNTAMIVDFMSIIRRQYKNMTVFKDIIKLAWPSVQNSCEFNHLGISFIVILKTQLKKEAMLIMSPLRWQKCCLHQTFQPRLINFEQVRQQNFPSNTFLHILERRGKVKAFENSFKWHTELWWQLISMFWIQRRWNSTSSRRVEPFVGGSRHSCNTT